MSNSTVVDSYAAVLNTIQVNVTRFIYPAMFLLGNLGSVLNILILSQRNYRHNSCSSYILASTYTNLIIINFVIFFRILNIFGIDPSVTSSFFCKFRMYIAQASTQISRIYIILACVDRWAMTSTDLRRRAFTQMKYPKILIPSIAIAWCVSTIHMPFYQDIVKGRCIITSNGYLVFYNIYATLISGLLTPVLMMVFSFLALRNVRQLRQRVQPLSTVNAIGPTVIYHRNYEYQLFFMILAQQCVYVITTIPFASYLFYSALTVGWEPSSTKATTDNFYMNMVYVLVHCDFCTTFYIYILTTSAFRRDLKKLLCYNRLGNRIFGIRQTVLIVPAQQQQQLELRMRSKMNI